MPRRMIDTELWNDTKVVEDFTAEDTYFWCYLLTSPHGSICGVVKCSPVIIGREMKYSTDCINNLIERFEKCHKIIKYNKENSEILILHWDKYNWTSSLKLTKALRKNIENIKTVEFREYIISKIKSKEDDDIIEES